MFKRLWSYLRTGGPPPTAPGVSAHPSGTRATPAKTPEIQWNIPARDAENWLREHDQAIVLDVRTAEEFAAGHLRGARHLDYFDPRFQENLAGFDKHRPYLVHCASGHRSTRARSLLTKLGFQRVYQLEGGLKAWIAEGKPLVSP